MGIYSFGQVIVWKMQNRNEQPSACGDFTVSFDELCFIDADLSELRELLRCRSEVIIGEIDSDGFLLSKFSEVMDVPSVSGEVFKKRSGNKLSIMSFDGKVGIKKQYKTWVGFVREYKILKTLGESCNVPCIMDVDFNKKWIVLSYLLGDVLREQLALRGAVIRDRDIMNNTDFDALSPSKTWLKRIKNGRKFVGEVLNSTDIDQIFRELVKIHQLGVCVYDIKYGNIIIEKYSRTPYFIDFERSYLYGRNKGLIWEIRRDWDIEKFNLLFNTKKITRKRILEKLAQCKRDNGLDISYTVKLNGGIYLGGRTSSPPGQKLWNEILRPNLGSLAKKNIVGFGKRAVYFLVEMLKQGAADVLLLAYGQQSVDQAQFIKECIDWADSTVYPIKIIDIGTKGIEKCDLGSFDILLSFDKKVAGKLFHECEIDPNLFSNIYIFNHPIEDDAPDENQVFLPTPDKVDIREVYGFPVLREMHSNFSEHSLLICAGE